MNAKGCLASLLVLPVAFVLALVLLFTMLAGGTDASTPVALASFNSTGIPGEYVAWIEVAASQCPVVTAPLIAAQLKQESGFDPVAVSPAGAEGIAQFMPDTWTTWGRDDDHSGDVTPWNPRDAIVAMGRFDCAIAKQVAAVPGDLVSNILAGYNAGPAAVVQYGGVPPYPETQNYVTAIKALIPQYTTALTAPTGTGSSFDARELAVASAAIGLPYVWGGGDTQGPTGGGFDCSGLIIYAVYQASDGKISLSHSSNDQARYGTEITDRADMRPGDVIAFALDPSHPTDFDHIGIYAGDDQLLDAPHPGAYVRLEPLDTQYWQAAIWEIRRYG